MFQPLRFQSWKAIILICLVAGGYPTAGWGQGDEPAFREADASNHRGFGGTLQRIFGPREKGPEATPQSRPPATRSMKPGIFQGGIVKQFQAMTDRQEPEDFRAESNASPTERMDAPIPMPPSQMAQRSPREPFSSESSPAAQPRTAPPSRTTPSRDVFAEDPPSIVGTGVDVRRYNAPRPESRANEGSDGLPPLPQVGAKPTAPSTPPSYNAYKNSQKPYADEELPRVTRRTIPGAEVKPAPSNSPNGYAIPNNPYTAPGSSASGDSSSPRSNAKAAAPPPSSVAAPTAPATNQGQPATTNKNASTDPPLPTANRSATSSSEPRLEMGIPKVKLFVSGPSSLQVGKAIPYEILVRNDGSEILGGVIVSMMIPPFVKSSMPVATAGEFESEKDAAGVETLLWHVADLGPAQSRVFRVNLEASKTEHFGMDVEWTVLPQTGRVEVDVQQPQLNLALEGPAEVMWGKPEVYRMRVRNPGNAEAKDVEVRLSAEAYGSNQTKLGNIPAGSERIVEIELTFQHSGSIKIAGEAASAVDLLESKSSIDVNVTQISLAAEWISPSEQFQDSVGQHSMKISNSSPVAAENVACVAILPPGLKPATVPEGASQVGNEIRWSVPKIGPNASLVFDFMLQATEAGQTKLIGNAQCQGGGKATAESLVTIESVSDLKLTVTDPVAPAPVGQDVVYDLTIVNRGSKTAKAVKLLAQFSHGIEPLRADGATARILPGQVVFDPIAAIEPGQEITLRVVAQAAEPGMHRFRAELECDDSETQLVQEETTRYLATTRSESSKTIRR